MDVILRFLPALACPLIMGLMMWVMSRQGKDNTQASAQPRQISNMISPDLPPVALSTRLQLMNGVKKAYSLVSCCLNWKVLTGIAVVGVGVWLFAPTSLGAAVPVLIALLCPVSMFLMMRNMNKNSSCANEPHATQPEQASSTVIIDATPRQMRPTVSIDAAPVQQSLQPVSKHEKAAAAKLNQEG